ncbi:MAG: chemotaxis protein CheW [Aphanothece sp. CMT-3BRIN-NPC111]|jgi:twitching motility protein PilI|nr:chemotaxis protein CheW [Aphanothece sp. CMT-3BRIN-NPC111]
MNTSIISSQQNQQQKAIGDAYLKFQLEPQTTAVLSMEYAQEVVVVPFGRITPIPRMSSYIRGLLNRRNKLLWVIDIAQMLGLQPIDANVQQYNIAIIRVGQIPLGLMVREVKGVTRFTRDSIQSPLGTIVANMTPYLQGCILQQMEILLVLDPEAIVNSPSLQTI